MAYYFDPHLDKEKKDQLQTTQKRGGESSISNVSAGVTQKQADPSETGSGFVNLDKYLQANAGQNFGAQVIGKAQEQVDKAKTGQKEATGQVREQIQSANNLPNQTQVNEAIANPTSAKPEEFQSWMNAKYNGPNDLSSNKNAYNQFWNPTTKAAESAKYLTGSATDRTSLLDSYFGKPGQNYTKGQQKLDSVLASGSQGFGANAQQIKNQSNLLNAQGNQRAQDLSNQATVRAGEVGQSAANARAAIGVDANGNILTGDKAGAIGKAQQKVEDGLKAANEARAKGVLTPEQLQKLGIDQDTTYGINLKDYFKPGEALNKDQYMTPEQRAQIEALSKLAGVDNSYIKNPAQAATPDSNFDIDKYRADKGVKEAAYKSEYQKAFDALKTAPIRQVAGGIPENASPSQVLEVAQKYYDTLTRMIDDKNARGQAHPDLIRQRNQVIEGINAFRALIAKYGVK